MRKTNKQKNYDWTTITDSYHHTQIHTMINLCAIQPRLPDSRYFFAEFGAKKVREPIILWEIKEFSGGNSQMRNSHSNMRWQHRLRACVYSVSGGLLRCIGNGAQRRSLLAFNLQGSITSLWPENEKVKAKRDTHIQFTVKKKKKHTRTHPACWWQRIVFKIINSRERSPLNTPSEELQYQSTYVSADPGSRDLDTLRSPQSFLSDSFVFGEGRLSLVIWSLFLVVIVIWKTETELRLKQQKSHPQNPQFLF